MIIPSITVPNLQATAQHQQDAVSGVPTETSVIARIPYRAVPATVAQRELYNDTRSQPSFDRLGSGASVGEGGVSTSSTSSASVGFSAPFMTQWMSQSGANDNALIASWMKVSRSTLTPEVLEEYSQVKYRPSGAGKPAPDPRGIAAMLSELQHASVKTQPQQPVVATPTTPAGNVQAPAVQADQLQLALDDVQETVVVSRAAEAGTSLQSRAGEALPKPVVEAAKPSVTTPARQIRFNTSLIRDTGFDAYAATFSRNMLNADQGNSEPLKLTA